MGCRGTEPTLFLFKIPNQGREGDGKDQFVTRKTGGGNLAGVGEGIMDFLVQPAPWHLPVGKDGYEFKIADSWNFLL
jgi:hypothetical protein